MLYIYPRLSIFIMTCTAMHRERILLKMFLFRQIIDLFMMPAFSLSLQMGVNVKR